MIDGADFHIQAPRRGLVEHQVRVPIPPGREPQAQRALEQGPSAE
jgi:hypothetical protein